MIVETIKAVLTGDSKQMESAFQRAEQATKKFAAGMGKASAAMAKASAVMIGFGTLMIREAAKFDGHVAKAVETLKNQFLNLAVEIGRALLPALESMARILSAVVNWLRSIDPDTRKWVGSLLAASAGILLVGSGLTTVISMGAGLFAALIPVLPVLAAIAVGLAGIYLHVVIFQTFFGGVWDHIKNQAQLAMDLISRGWRAMTSSMGSVIKDYLIEPLDVAFKFILGQLATMLELMAKIPGAPDWVGTLAETVRDVATRGIGGVLDDLKDGATVIGETLVAGAEKMGKTMKGHWAWAKKMLGGLVPSAAPGAGPQDTGPGVELKGGWQGDVSVPASVDAGEIGKAFETFEQRADTAFDTASNSAAAFAQSVLNTGLRLGALGDILQGVASKGIIGGIIALSNKADEMEAVMAMLDLVIGGVAQVFNLALRPFTELFGALRAFIPTIMAALSPVLAMLSSTLRPIAAMLVLLGGAFEPLAPAIKILLGAVLVVAGPINMLISLAFPVLFEVFKFFYIAALKLVQMVAPLWNSIAGGLTEMYNALLRGIAGFFRWVAGFDIAGAKPFAFLNGWADALENATIPTHKLNIDLDKLAKEIAKTEKLSYGAALARAREVVAAEEAAAATQENADAQADAAKQIEEFSESLTNVPEGFKVAAARYGAIDTGDAGAVMGSGFTAEKPTINVYVDSKQIAAEVLVRRRSLNQSMGQPALAGEA